jgi:uncharacterized repeat protein (TIGR03847 family)
MTRRLFIFDEPDRFVTGTVGAPGNRTFYLQARKGKAVVSVVLEKSQVAVLAARMTELLSTVDRPPPAFKPIADDAPLDEPLVEVFRVGAMALAWDPSRERVMIEAQTEDAGGEYLEVADEEDDGPDLMRVRLVPEQAHAFVGRAERLVSGGRPICPYCGEPLDPAGHFCARANGLLN